MCKTKQNAHQITSLQNSCYFFAFFRRAKHEAGIPSPVARVSGSPLAARNASLRWPKKREKMTLVLQSIRLQITDSNPFVRWLKKKKKNRLFRQKGSCLPFTMTFNMCDAQQEYTFVFDGKERRSFGRESLTLWMCFVIRDSKSK